MGMKAEGSEDKTREELRKEFLKLELLHLVKSGNENPKIIEHFMGRVKKFLELPDDTVFPTISLGDVESMRNLAGFISRLKVDINYIQERVNKLKKELGQSDVLNSNLSESVTPPKASDESEPGHGPRMK